MGGNPSLTVGALIGQRVGSDWGGNFMTIPPWPARYFDSSSTSIALTQA